MKRIRILPSLAYILTILILFCLHCKKNPADMERNNPFDSKNIINEDMIYIPAGKFFMGSDSGETDEKPVHEVYLDAYCIDRYEVTNRKYAEFLNEMLTNSDIQANNSGVTKGGNELLDLDDTKCQISYTGGSFTVKNGRENYPVIEVTWFGADAYAKHYDKRLPTEAEWEKAARGADQRTYPWGNDTPNTNYCNFNYNIGHTAPVGQYSPTGDSPYGCADMAGNVEEWCSDWYDSSYYSSSPTNNPQGSPFRTTRVVRGGSLGTQANGIRCADRVGCTPAYSYYAYGFRCVR